MKKVKTQTTDGGCSARVTLVGVAGINAGCRGVVHMVAWIGGRV
jgi:hypothetical protein